MTINGTPASAPQLPLHIPSIDGLRAISIALVIFAHAASTRGAPAFLDHPQFTSLGNVGVRFFFIISGFLITSLLLRDMDRYGHIRLSTFYVRRAFRILPAAFFYIGVIWILHLNGVVNLAYHQMSETVASSAIPDLLHALSFTSNYQLDYNWYYNHLWSLSVEEQFYLIWPFALLYFGIRYGKRAVIAVILIVPFIRLAMAIFGDQPEIALTREFQAVCDSLAAGCLTALTFNQLRQHPFLMALTRWPAVPLGGLCIAIGYGVALFYRPAAYVLGQTLANAGIVLLLLHAILYPGSLFGRLLNTRLFIAVGILSYSLYLWQEPFLYFASSHWATAFPLNIALSFAAATVSYFLIERPFLALKERLSSKRAVSQTANKPLDSISPP